MAPGASRFAFSLFAGWDTSPMTLGGTRPHMVHVNTSIRRLHHRPLHSYKGALCVVAPPGPHVLRIGLLGRSVTTVSAAPEDNDTPPAGPYAGSRCSYLRHGLHHKGHMHCGSARTLDFEGRASATSKGITVT